MMKFEKYREMMTDRCEQASRLNQKKHIAVSKNESTYCVVKLIYLKWIATTPIQFGQ